MVIKKNNRQSIKQYNKGNDCLQSTIKTLINVYSRCCSVFLLTWNRYYFTGYTCESETETGNYDIWN